MSGRGVLAIAVLAAWGAGLVALVQRETSRSPRERLAEAATRVAPGATYFAVERAGEHVGFASSTIDTIPGGLQVTDYLVADLPGHAGAGVRRATAQAVIRLSRALVLREFTLSVSGTDAPVSASGRVVGDSTLEYVVSMRGSAGDTVRQALDAPLLLPTLLPLAVALGNPPKVGRQHTMATFDPLSMSVRAAAMSLQAESLFVVVDSAVYDAGTRRWVAAHTDALRGWRLATRDAVVPEAWIDEQGRILAASLPAGLALRRTAYESAFENWRIAAGTAVPVAAAGGRWTRTVVGAGLPFPPASRDTLRVRLGGVDLSRLAIDGDGQALAGDTVTIVRRDPRLPITTLVYPPTPEMLRRFSRELRAEPRVAVEHPAIVALAQRLRDGDGRADLVAARLTRWVHDSVAKPPPLARPGDAATLRARSGDVNVHARLLVALARATGIPARTVSGVVLVEGEWWYHAWAELFLQSWTPVDPTFDQLPADAAHLRLLVGGVSMQAELTRVLDRMQISILAAPSNAVTSPPGSVAPASLSALPGRP